MLLVVQSQTSHGLDIWASQGGQEELNFSKLVCNSVLTEYVALDNSGFCNLGDVGFARGKDSVAVVYLAILSEKAD